MPAAEGLVNLLKDKGAIRGIEIGVFRGDSSRYLLEHLPQLILHGIDPYVEYRDWNGTINHRLHDLDPAYLYAESVKSEFGNRYMLYKDYAEKISHIFTDSSYDFIFIDGLHTHEQVRSDYSHYYTKVKQGGIISGHDYDKVYGVKLAVDEIAKLHNKEVLKLENDVWYWIKDY